MNSGAYNLDKLVDLLRPEWPWVSKRTIHYYASKGIIDRRRRGLGAEYNEIDRLKILVAVSMREAGEKLKDIAVRIGSMNREALEEYLRHPLPPRPIERMVISHMRDFRADQDSVRRVDEHVIAGENRPATWSRIPLGDGVELGLRTDVTLSERLPGIIATLQNLATH